MTTRLFKIAKTIVLLVGVVILAIFAVRAYDAFTGPPLDAWHVFVPDELSVDEIEVADWEAYVEAEDDVMAAVRREVTEKLPDNSRIPGNRYFEGSPLYPGSFAKDWNRSFELLPDGVPVGAVVLLHGLTDSPYSLRHLARHYRDRGYVAIGIRMPGHGTVPAGLTDATWKDWMAATRLAIREAAARIDQDDPLHVVGYSNGGALAVKYALDALDDPQLRQPDRLVLISPMIGITAFARFAGLAGLPAIFPAFARASWLDIAPEFNPFKYNSFPVAAARQSHQLTLAVQRQVAARRGRLDGLPPILTFQSVVDFTVSTRAIVTSLYAHLPDNGSELVLFDINRSLKFGPLLRPAVETALNRLLPPPPRNFRTILLTNSNTGNDGIEARVLAAGATEEQVHALELTYPRNIFSLSHIALPFPVTDSLYGSSPDPSEDFGVNLGAIAPRGEAGVLLTSLDSILRVSSNPFYPYMEERIDQGINIAPETRDRIRQEGPLPMSQ